jgi:hypothetical protein
MDVEMPAGLSTYEQRQWDEIQLWKEHVVRPRKVRTPEPVRTKLQARRQPVPQFVQVVVAVLFELYQRYLIHTCRTIVGPHLPIGLPHGMFRDTERLRLLHRFLPPTGG